MSSSTPTDSLVPFGPAPADESAGSTPDLRHLLRSAVGSERRDWLAQVRRDQMQRWQRGEPCRVESYVGLLPRLRGDDEAILDLISNEVEIREEHHETPELVEYQQRFPKLTGQLASLFERHRASLAEAAAGPVAEQPTRSYALRPGSAPTPAAAVSETTHAEQGWRIAGYEILDTLGKGGMGVVYKARQLNLKRIVALKMIRGNGIIPDEDRVRFQREAEAVARLQHPNIVQIYEVGEAEGQPYLSLEYIDGGNLAKEIAGTPLPAARAAFLVESLARGIHAAHQAGIIHRDLKPANILLSAECGMRGAESDSKNQLHALLRTPHSALGIPKITDFGLAKQMEADDGHTRPDAVLGTPSYMAPEQAAGQVSEVGPLADVYAMGAILYEMLTGRPPFKGATLWETIDQVKSQEPVPPTRLNPGTPRDLETICLKCLEKERTRRYASALALAEDVQRHRNGEPILARPVPTWERCWKWVRRSPWKAGAAAAVAAILVAGVALLALGALFFASRSQLLERDLQALRQRGDAEIKRQQGMKALEEGRWKHAQEVLAQALAQIGDDPVAAALRADIQGLHEDASCGVIWRERYQWFLDRHFAATFHETLTTGRDLDTHLLHLKQAATDALHVFGVDRAAPRPALQIPERYFPEQERDAIRVACRGLLLMLASAEGHPRPKDTDQERRRRAEGGLQTLQWAAAEVSGTRSYHFQRADYLERLGQGAEAEQARRAAPAQPVDALDHFRLGLERFAADDLETASGHLHTVLRLQPRHFWAHYRLALCQVRLAEQTRSAATALPRWAAAEAHLTTCRGEQPAFVWSRIVRGHVRTELGHRESTLAAAARPDAQAAHLARAASHFQSAGEDFNEAAQLQPDEEARYAILTERGLLHYRQGKHADAVADLSQAVQLRPTLVAARLALAQAHARQRKPALALAELERAITQEPRQAALYRTRASIHMEAGNHIAALEDLDQAVALEASSNRFQRAADHVERGRLYQHQKDYKQAAAAYDRAVELWPAHAGAWKERGFASFRQAETESGAEGRWQCYETARRSLDRFIQLEKPDAQVYRLRGLIQARLALLLGRAKDLQTHQASLLELQKGAVEDYGRALDLEPDDRATRARRGWDLLLMMDAPKLALADFRRVVQEDPQNAHAYNGRGLCRVQLGQWRDAATDAQTALKLGRETETGKDRTFLLLNAARIHSQVAGCINREMAGRLEPKLIEVRQQHEQEAIARLAQALDNLAEGERGSLWQDVQADPALAAIRRLANFKNLEATYGKAPRPSDRP